MRQKKNESKPLDVDTLWRLARVGVPTLSADGRQAVVAVTRYSMDDNRGRSTLWRLATDGGAPRELTHCGDKDGQPAFSPCSGKDGDRIAFIARREQQGQPGMSGLKDKTPQLYLLPADGGEAARASDFAPGVEAFRWLPDGRGIVFIAWVWPELRGAAAQARRHAEFSARKESGLVTEQAQYRHFDHDLPMGRVPHLLRLDLKTRRLTDRVTDLFEGTPFELPRAAPGTEHFAVHPRGTHVAFVFDPAAEKRVGNPRAIAELDLASGAVQVLAQDAAWDFGAPAYSPDGTQLACTAANTGAVHTAPDRLALIGRAAAPKPRSRKAPGWRIVSDPAWDLEVEAPLRWAADGRSLLFAAEARGRRPLWRCALDTGAVTQVIEGGWVHGFELTTDVSGAELIVATADSVMHPPRVHAHRAGAAPLRLERFNDEILAGVALGEVHETTVTGALGDPVQVWLVRPPGFDAKKKHGVMQVIHGGPFAAAGDTFGWRWNPHVLASRGHVVVQVNYHGSSGFGHAFKHAIMGRMGQLELQDIEAATDAVLARRWADKRRVFATGGSYGGFMVAWMNGHVPAGRYRAYVCHAGVFDRVSTFSADSYLQRPKDLGAFWFDDMPKVQAQSPASFAGAMATPTLVIHGAQDFRVPDANGLAYYNTLKARGVPARLLWFADENHWVLKPRNSRQWYGEFLDWIAAHDRPPAAA